MNLSVCKVMWCDVMQYAICFNALGCMYCNVSQCMRVEKATEGTLPQFAAQGLNGFIKAMCDPLCTYVECAYSTCRTHAHIFESARLCISRCSSLSLSALSLPPFSLLYLSFCLSNQFYSLMCVCVCLPSSTNGANMRRKATAENTAHILQIQASFEWHTTSYGINTGF